MKYVWTHKVEKLFADRFVEVSPFSVQPGETFRVKKPTGEYVESAFTGLNYFTRAKIGKGNVAGFNYVPMAGGREDVYKFLVLIPTTTENCLGVLVGELCESNPSTGTIELGPGCAVAGAAKLRAAADALDGGLKAKKPLFVLREEDGWRLSTEAGGDGWRFHNDKAHLKITMRIHV